MTAYGTKRTSRDAHSLVRFWSEADMHCGVASTASVADDAVDGAHSPASRCHRVVASKRTT
jgi:hypothetical protein